MMLSVIIVSYNVKNLLQNCLVSLKKATENIANEIFVIDNNSTDGSHADLKPKFPAVNFIANDKNIGFGKACNQGLKIATGEYILFLNPDTLLPDNIFTKCLQKFSDNHTIGAIGVKMVDGNGNFLKESKRALPTPVSSFFKLSGLSALFPKSKKFSKYNLGHLNENRDHVVDVLCGAFMMVRKSILDTIGGFDEAFFMYGEDIDLSYRIQQAGYKNYYIGEASIIHFKGKSTNKKSIKYIHHFYGAMAIFVSKHYKGSKKWMFKMIIYFAIGLSAGVAVLKSPVKQGR